MQDEVRDKSVALVIQVGKTGGKLTADLLKWAMRRYLERAKNPKIHHGRQTVKVQAFRILRSQQKISSPLSAWHENMA